MRSPIASFQRPLWVPVAAASVLALVAGCATEAPPQAQMAVGQAAVERASGSAAAEAPTEVSAARDKIARARVAFANKDYALARQLAQEAEADAMLAEAQARSARADRALTAVRDSIRQLRLEMVQQ